MVNFLQKLFSKNKDDSKQTNNVKNKLLSKLDKFVIFEFFVKDNVITKSFVKCVLSNEYDFANHIKTLQGNLSFYVISRSDNFENIILDTIVNKHLVPSNFKVQDYINKTQYANAVNSCEQLSLGSGMFGNVYTDPENASKVIKKTKKPMGQNEIIFATKMDGEKREKYTLLINDENNKGTNMRRYRKCFGYKLSDELQRIRSKSIDERDKQNELKNLYIKTAEALLSILVEMDKFKFSHCDIKPENIMICSKNKNVSSEISVKLIDIDGIINDEISCKESTHTGAYSPTNSVTAAKFFSYVPFLQLHSTTNNLLQTADFMTSYSSIKHDTYSIGLVLALIYPYESELLTFAHDLMLGKYETPIAALEFFTNNVRIEKEGGKYNVIKTGGGNSKKIMLKNSKKIYTVKTDSQNKKYIGVKKTKFFLSDLRGKYIYI